MSAIGNKNSSFYQIAVKVGNIIKGRALNYYRQHPIVAACGNDQESMFIMTRNLHYNR